MNVMTVETSDPIVFRKATALLRKLNVKICVLEQDAVVPSKKVEDDDDFEKEWANAMSSDEFYSKIKKTLSKNFNENGENIHLLNKNKG